MIFSELKPTRNADYYNNFFEKFKFIYTKFSYLLLLVPNRYNSKSSDIRILSLSMKHKNHRKDNKI